MKPPKPTKPAVLGAGHRIDVASARRIEAANKKLGFPTPPHVQAVLDAAEAAPPANAKPADASGAA